MKRRRKLHGMGYKDRMLLREKLFKKQGGICHLCGGEMALSQSSHRYFIATLDHFEAKANGGTNDPSNFRMAHHGCNSIRGHQNIVGVPLVCK